MFKHYPRLTAVVLTYLVAFGVFAAVGPMTAHNLVEPLGIGGIILAGALYTYGFTASIGAVLLIALAPDYSPVVLALLGGIGATISDITIFTFIRGSLHKEINQLAKHTTVARILKSRALNQKWIRDILGFLVIASPLPDEVGITFLTMTRMDDATFRIVDFTANVLGIYILAIIATLVY